MDAAGVFRISVASELYKVRPILAAAIDFVRESAPYITRQDESDLRLILSELMFNAVIHGNKRDKAKLVHIEIGISGGFVKCRVTDEGIGFDHKRLIAGLDTGARAGGDMLWSEHGRGIRLVLELSEELIFNDSGNTVQALKKVSLDG